MSSSSPWPCSESWKAWAVPWKLALSVAGSRSSRCTASTCATASLSDTPGFGLKEIVTDGQLAEVGHRQRAQPAA